MGNDDRCSTGSRLVVPQTTRLLVTTRMGPGARQLGLEPSQCTSRLALKSPARAKLTLRRCELGCLVCRVQTSSDNLRRARQRFYGAHCDYAVK